MWEAVLLGIIFLMAAGMSWITLAYLGKLIRMAKDWYRARHTGPFERYGHEHDTAALIGLALMVILYAVASVYLIIFFNALWEGLP